MVSREDAFAIYRKIYLVRKCEETIRQVYNQNEIKTPVHLCNGSEAIAVCVILALPAGSKVFGTYRNHGLYLMMTEDTDGFFSELYGKSSGCLEGKAGSMHLALPERGFVLTSAIVGTTIPVAVGAALAHSYRAEEKYVAVFFGDGALDEGAFWESLNFACLKKLRVLFVCEDNGLAIHADKREREGYRSILDVVRGFHCYSGGGEGYLPEKVLSLTRELLVQMSKEAKPAFLHFDYFRFLEHVGVNEDFEAGYREKPNSETLTQKDPLIQAERIALAKGCSTREFEAVRKSLDEKITLSLSKAQQAPFPNPRLLTDHVFA